MEGSHFYLEDLAVGQRFTTGSLELEGSQIKAFAEEFDPQPFHLDAEIAKTTLFRGLVASGWHTAAITMRLLVTGGIPLPWGMIGVECSIKWPSPARAGDILTVHGEVTEVKPSRSRPDRGTISIRAETRNQRDETLQILTATLLVPRRSTTAGS